MLIKGRQRNVRISSNMDYNRYNSKLNQALISNIIVILDVCKIIIRKKSVSFFLHDLNPHQIAFIALKKQ